MPTCLLPGTPGNHKRTTHTAAEREREGSERSVPSSVWGALWVVVGPWRWGAGYTTTNVWGLGDVRVACLAAYIGICRMDVWG